MAQTDLARKQLDRRLSRLQPVEEWSPPPRGWLRAVRDALGMTAAQTASRIGVSAARVLAMEKAEQCGRVQLATLRRAAEALDCTLMYALVPNSSLDATVRDRARRVAGEQLGRVAHSMRLENKGVEADDLRDERERLVDALLRGDLHRLWDAP